MTSGETMGRLAAHSLQVLNPAERQNLHQSGNIIRAALQDAPEVAIGVYESEIKAATTPLVANRLKAVFEPHIDYARIGSTILDGAPALTAIANAYHGARRSDRRTLVKAASQALLRLGLHADDDAASMGALSTLAERLPRWVLDGTVQQQVVCKLAIHLGLTNATPPRALVDVLRNSMSPALQTVIDIGAPATRDIALEGLGALLKILPGPKCLAPLWTNHDGEGDAEINKRYVARRRRRYLLVGAIAGDTESQVKYFEKLRQPPDEDFDARVAYLRALPAIWRQTAAPTPAVLDSYVGFLTQAASIDRAEADGLGVSRAAFARFREGVFTTISVMMRRDASPRGFDKVIARAVERLPLTLVGTAADGNAESRATIAIITAAGNVVAAADVEAAEANSHEESACHGALEVLFGNLDQLHSVWSNPGLAEGCFRSLPTILAGGKKWAAKGLDGALKTLRNDVPSNDFVALHRRVIANACLRTLLVALVDRMHDRLLEFHIAADEQVYERDLDHAVAILLAEPTARNIQKVFDPKYNPVAGARGDLPSSLSESVITAAASANDLQRNLESSYAAWTKLDAPCQLLLTRILAAELRASSQEAREVTRYPLLRKRLDSVSSVVVSDEERQERLWKLLSILPSQAAEAVHADLEEFVEYRSGRSFAHTSNLRERDPSDLPGYILAMIDESVSLRLARHISREVDLNLRRARAKNPNFDFAVQLYQVTLRGPSEAIFDHLLSRIDDHVDRGLVSLFRRHVASVRATGDGKASINRFVEDIGLLLPDIAKHQTAAGSRSSHTLDALANVLQFYLELAARDETIWSAMVGEASKVRPGADDASLEGGFHKLLVKLDRIASETHVRHHDAIDDDPEYPSGRRSLADLCEEDCSQLRAEVTHYVSLPIKQFEERHRAMRHASDVVQRIEDLLSKERSLQPPEQILLRVLLGYWRDVFNGTKEWYVDAPRRCVETKKPDTFWALFASEPENRTEEQERQRRFAQMIVREESLVDGHIDTYMRERYSGRQVPTPADLGLIGAAPPAIAEQRENFERFYVDWMSSELDVDHLTSALNDRWETWFKRAYFVATNLPSVILFTALPFIVAALLHAFGGEAGRHFEGILFLAYAAAIVGATLYLLTRRLWRITEKLRYSREPKKNENAGEKHLPPQYLYQCILPSLFRLIIVPFVLLVEFDHSYTFPMYATDGTIVLLMVLAFLTTQYFVRREILRHDDDRDAAQDPMLEQRHAQVQQIVALALAQSFALALIFSLIFESNTISRHKQQVAHFDGMAAGQAESVFLGVVPKTAQVDLGTVMVRWHLIKPPQKARFCWDVYPTMILSWTALGLFFGAFLEGFIRGERLRGEVA